MRFELEGTESEQLIKCDIESVLAKLSAMDPVKSITLAKDAILRIAAYVVDTGANSISDSTRYTARDQMNGLSLELSTLSMQLAQPEAGRAGPGTAAQN